MGIEVEITVNKAQSLGFGENEQALDLGEGHTDDKNVISNSMRILILHYLRHVLLHCFCMYLPKRRIMVGF